MVGELVEEKLRRLLSASALSTLAASWVYSRVWSKWKGGGVGGEG